MCYPLTLILEIDKYKILKYLETCMGVAFNQSHFIAAWLSTSVIVCPLVFHSEKSSTHSMKKLYKSDICKALSWKKRLKRYYAVCSKLKCTDTISLRGQRHRQLGGTRAALCRTWKKWWAWHYLLMFNGACIIMYKYFQKIYLKKNKENMSRPFG